MRRPSVEQLPAHLASGALAIASELAARGRRAWIVGGAVRDLARGAPVNDVDMVSDVPPDEIEAAFASTHSVGKAFGTVVVHLQGLDVQVTTFRSESGYRDARRPDRVRFGRSLEEDAKRRDFTCNALYLDPLTDELRDPEGGLTDLDAGVLRTVGDPLARFREDGLRLFRMARFEATLDLAPAPGLHEAARASADALRGVSAERVAEELARVLAGPRAARALGVLSGCGLLERALPAWRAVAAGSLPWESVQAAREVALAALPDPPGVELGLACLLEVDPLGPGAGALERGRELAESLRLSRARREALALLWSARRAWTAAARPDAPRSERARAVRGERALEAWRLARAWAQAAGGRADALDELRRWCESLAPDELFPRPLLAPADLAAAGVPRGPAWRQLLASAETEQLEGRLATHEEARRWLERAAGALTRDDQDGGKRRRKRNESG